MSLPEYASLGFDFEDFEDLSAALEDAEGTSFEADGYEEAVVYQDPSGPRLTALREEGDGATVVPGFFSPHTMPARVYRAAQHLCVAELPSGEAVACACDESFALPAAFPGGGERFEAENLELTAAAVDYTVSDTVTKEEGATVLRSADTENYYRTLSPRSASPYGELRGVIVGAEERVNELTGQSFWVAGLELPGGLITLALPRPVAVGAYFSGRVFLMASSGLWTQRLRLRG